MSKILNNNAKFKMLQFGPVKLYGLGKVHKPVAVWWPALWLILSAIKTPLYKLAKFFVLLLTPLGSND